MIPVVANGIPIVLVPPPLMPPLSLPFDPQPNNAAITFNGFPVVTVPFTMGGFPGVPNLMSVSLFNLLPCIFVGTTIVLSNGYTCVVPPECGAGPTVDVL